MNLLEVITVYAALVHKAGGAKVGDEGECLGRKGRGESRCLRIARFARYGMQVNS